MTPPRNRRFLLAFLLVTLLVAGVVSTFASSSPDGLERVAEQTGFLHTAEESPAADSPLADYETAGVEDERASVGLAGVAGVLTVLALTGGLAWALRRRGPAAPPGGPGEGPTGDRPAGEPDEALR